MLTVETSGVSEAIRIAEAEATAQQRIDFISIFVFLSKIGFVLTGFDCFI